jgi:hypothetical protein
MVGVSMLRVAVTSRSVASIGYDRRKRMLEIEFRPSGDLYRYFDVPDEEHAAFMAAESKGSYLNHILKSRGYHYTIVCKGKEQIG